MLWNPVSVQREGAHSSQTPVIKHASSAYLKLKPRQNQALPLKVWKWLCFGVGREEGPGSQSGGNHHVPSATTASQATRGNALLSSTLDVNTKLFKTAETALASFAESSREAWLAVRRPI